MVFEYLRNKREEGEKKSLMLFNELYKHIMAIEEVRQGLWNRGDKFVPYEYRELIHLKKYALGIRERLEKGEISATKALSRLRNQEMGYQDQLSCMREGRYDFD